MSKSPIYRRHRFPPDVIAYAVWLYFKFPLSLRMVEDLLARRGIIVSHQTIRKWAEKFGRQFAHKIRKRAATSCDDKWHLDEVVISIQGQKHWLWRAVDQNGFVLDVLVQSRRNAKAAERLMRKLLSQHGTPRVIVTDKLGSGSNHRGSYNVSYPSTTPSPICTTCHATKCHHLIFAKCAH